MRDAMNDGDFKKTQFPIMMAIAAQGKKERAREELLERQSKNVMLFCDNPECISLSLDNKQVWICCCKNLGSHFIKLRMQGLHNVAFQDLHCSICWPV
jgi:hypothetical protein